MSGYTDFIEKGIDLLHKGEVKTVENYHFISDGGHNSDLIVVCFTDGTNTGKEGFEEIEMCEKNRKCPFCENEIDVTACRMCGEYPTVNRNRQIVCCNVECDNYNEPYPVNEWLGIE